MGSLLEVGTGFHPELTGRENIYLNGAILGMRRAEIARKFDEIVAFSEIERFLDTPVKRYSSGMYVRLAFAVAAHLEPEILVVDEVLAVGDAAFQKKCLGKMGEVARQGRTVLFVSHNMEAVRRLCSRTVMLSQGQLAADGETESVIAEYLNSGRQSETNSVRYGDDKQPGDEYVHLRGVRLANDRNEDTEAFRIDEAVVVEIEYEVLKPIANFHNYLRVFSGEGTLLFGSGDWDMRGLCEVTHDVGVYTATATVPAHLLNFGRYSVTIMGVVPDVRYVYFEEHVLGFEVAAVGGAGEGTSLHRPGLLRPVLDWRCSTQNGPMISA
jgi:lipopolysaccharide transport system ATP-binding protein